MNAPGSFKLTYSTMFDPPPELHSRFDAALAAIRGRLGSEHAMLIGGANVRAPSIEARGDGRAGPKASGILAADGALWLLVRNVGSSRLARSADRGATWTWAGWKFEGTAPPQKPTST